MKVMSLNGWGGRLYHELAAYLSSEQPDVLCLQEVVHSPATAKDWLDYRDGDHVLPQRANFLRDVGQVLPAHTVIFCVAAQGELWDGDVPVPSQWGLATFVHRSLPIIAQAQGFVHKDYSPFGYGEHPRSRSAHAIRVFDYRHGRALSITHMHGLRDLNGKSDTAARAAQAHRLLDLSRQVSQPGELAIICGDFNVEPGSETLAILKDGGFSELVTSRGFAGTRSSYYGKAGRFADYMLVNELEAVARFEVVGAPEVSDHCPLVLEV